MGRAHRRGSGEGDTTPRDAERKGTRGGGDATIADDVARGRRSWTVTPRHVMTMVVGLAACAAVIPVLIGMVNVQGAEYQPSFDHAVHELLVRDVPTEDRPLVGPSTTAGNMNHPGPLPFSVLSVPYRALGSASWGLFVGAGAVAVVSMAFSIAVAVLVGGRWLGLAMGVFLAVFLHSAGVSAALDFWNPSIAQYPFLLYLVSAWGVAAGRRWLLPLLAVTGSFVAQAHAGFLPMVGLVGIWAVGALGWGEVARPAPATARWDRWRFVVPVTVVVIAGCWAAPISQQRSAVEGNLSLLVRYGASHDHPSVGAGVAAEVMAHQLGWVPTWLGKADADERTPHTAKPGPLSGLLVPVAALAGAGLVAWRRRNRMLGALVGTSAVAVVAGLYAGSGIEGEVFVHYVRWWWSISVIICLSAVGAVVGAFRDVDGVSPTIPDASPDGTASAGALPHGAAPDRPWRRWLSVGAAAIALLIVVGLSVATVRATPDRPWFVHADDVEMRAVTTAAVHAYRGEGPVRVDSDGTIEGVKLQTALQLQLERAGVGIAVDDSVEQRSVYGSARAARRPRAVLVASTGEQVGGLALPDHYQALAVVDRLDEREHIALLLLLAKGPEVTPPEAAARDDLLRHGTVRAVFLDRHQSETN